MAESRAASSDSTASGEQSSSTYHLPVARLLTFYHRTISEEDLPEVLYHLRQCPQCRNRLQKIQATVSLFSSTPTWRSKCPTTQELYAHASFELKEERAKEVQDHVVLCYNCREELLVFRDLRQSVRVGRSTFLDPTNWRLRSNFWRSRGLIAWLMQPRWRSYAVRSLQAVGVLVLLVLAYQVTQLDFNFGKEAKKRRTEGETPVAEQEKDQTPVELSAVSSTLYVFQYSKSGVRYLLPSDVAAVWASFQVENDTGTPGIFRVVEPPGEEGLMVLRPVRELTGPQLVELETQVKGVLASPARLQLQAWGQARARLQQQTGGAVWLLNPAPKETELGRLAGPDAGRGGGTNINATGDEAGAGANGTGGVNRPDGPGAPVVPHP